MRILKIWVVALAATCACPSAGQNPLDVLGNNPVATLGQLALSELFSRTRTRDQLVAPFGVLPVGPGVTIELTLADGTTAASARRAEQAWARLTRQDARLALDLIQDEATFRRLVLDTLQQAHLAAGLQAVASAAAVERESAARQRERDNPEVRQDSVPRGGDLERAMLTAEVLWVPLNDLHEGSSLWQVIRARQTVGNSVLAISYRWRDTGVVIGQIVVEIETSQFNVDLGGGASGPSRSLTYAHLAKAQEAAGRALLAEVKNFAAVCAGQLALVTDPLSESFMDLVEATGEALPDPRVAMVFTGGYAVITAGTADRVQQGSEAVINGFSFPIARVAQDFSIIRLMDVEGNVAALEAVAPNDAVVIRPALPQPTAPVAPTAPTTAPTAPTAPSGAEAVLEGQPTAAEREYSQQLAAELMAAIRQTPVGEPIPNLGVLPALPESGPLADAVANTWPGFAHAWARANRLHMATHPRGTVCLFWHPDRPGETRLGVVLGYDTHVDDGGQLQIVLQAWAVGDIAPINGRNWTMRFAPLPETGE